MAFLGCWPPVLKITSEIKTYDEDRVCFIKDKIIRSKQCCEFLIACDGEFIIRKWLPVLFIGDLPIADYEKQAKNTYCFYCHEPRELPKKGIITLGWHPDLPKMDTSFEWCKGAVVKCRKLSKS